MTDFCNEHRPTNGIIGTKEVVRSHMQHVIEHTLGFFGCSDKVSYHCGNGTNEDDKINHALKSYHDDNTERKSHFVHFGLSYIIHQNG